MGSKADILAAIDAAFGREPRPEHFTNYRHCDECAEHDETFRSRTPETIGLDELGNPGWDPVCFVNVEGYKHYMPAFARLALDGSEVRQTSEGLPYRHGYLDQFLFHLWEERLAAFGDAQRGAVFNLLEYVLDEMPEEADRSSQVDRLFGAIKRLREGAPDR
ncbi:MAG TPA: DUF6714 family protein [Planctomycetaceae bacterium]